MLRRILAMLGLRSRSTRAYEAKNEDLSRRINCALEEGHRGVERLWEVAAREEAEATRAHEEAARTRVMMQEMRARTKAERIAALAEDALRASSWQGKSHGETPS